MKRNKKVLKITQDSRVYKMTKRRTTLSCPICGPNKGCNTNYNIDNSWKTHRKTQWR